MKSSALAIFLFLSASGTVLADAPSPDFDSMSLPDLKAYYEDGGFIAYRESIKALLKRGEKEEIRKNLQDWHPNRSHYMTVWALAVLQPEEFTEDMAKLLTDQDPGVRYYAVYFLGGLGKAEYADAVGKLFSDKSSVVRGAAATYMGALKLSKYKPAITKLLGDPDKDVRERAQSVLAEMK